MGVDHKWLQVRIDSGALMATHHDGTRPGPTGLRKWHIKQADLRSFVRRYPEELNGRNVDLILLVELLVGIQPPGSNGAQADEGSAA